MPVAIALMAQPGRFSRSGRSARLAPRNRTHLAALTLLPVEDELRPHVLLNQFGRVRVIRMGERWPERK